MRAGGIGLPVECASENEKVVGANLVEAAFMEGPVVDQATRLVDDDEGEDSPGVHSVSRLPLE